MDNFFNQAIETMPKEELELLQLKRIKKTLKHAKANSPLYKKKLDGFNLDKFNSLKDLENLPFTTKDELIDGGSHISLAIPIEKTVEVHFSSGTTKLPVPSFLSKKDIKQSTLALSRTWYMQGIRKSSIFGMLATYGLFSAGLINHYAVQNIGALVIPVSGAPSEKVIQLIIDFKIDTTAAVASHYFHILRKIKEGKFDIKKSSLKTVIAGGEPFTEDQRRFIQENLKVLMLDQYGLCEINTGIAGECKYQEGLHLLADYAYPEIVDPVTGELLPPKQTGELVLTTLNKEASPLIRYKTGDLTSITFETCKCGRTMPRIDRIKERVSKTIFYKGLKLERDYISDVVVGASKYIDPYLWKFVFTSGTTDPYAEIKVSPNKNRSEESTIEFMETLIKKQLGFGVKVTFFDKKEINKTEGHKFSHFEEIKINK